MLCPLLFRALEPIELALLTQLLLDAFCRHLQVVSDGLRIQQITDRQHFLQKIRRSCKRDQGRPLRLQIQHFRAGSPVEPGSHRTERLRALRVAGASVPPRIRHIDRTEYRLYWRVSRVLAGVRLAPAGTTSSLLPTFPYLSPEHKILQASQQRFALGQIHAERFHRQFPPLEHQYIPPLFDAVGAYTNDLHPDIHGRNLQRCANSIKRALASLRLKRSGCTGPSSFSLRSMLWKPSSSAVRSRSQVRAG